jgi:hypothetical protein
MRAPQDEDNAALDRPSITCGWDPGRPNEPPLLLLHPTHLTLLRNDATTTEVNIVPIPPLNPFVSMRDPQDEDNDTLDRLSIGTCGRDPGRPHGPHLPHPTILCRDATTTQLNITDPIPPLKPSASMRARPDEDTALDRSSLVTCGWDPGKDDAEASLSDCETVLACPAYNDDGSTFADDFDVAGERSAGMDCQRRRARQRRLSETLPKKAMTTTLTQSLMTTRTRTRESHNLSKVLLVY